ncbi:MAG: DUF4332 domain-containing protein, partial [Candidatus Thermoplasmatota archaeon]|nr:DUF4332 domain-containing protein [Candidatus Thermoplasmatota archaeon]
KEDLTGVTVDPVDHTEAHEEATVAPIEGPEVIDIEGIGETYANRLEDAGIVTIPQLLEVDVAAIAKAAQVSEKVARSWVTMAELIEIKGIGPQYAELLVRAGISGQADLAVRDPNELAGELQSLEAGRENRIQGNVIGAKRVANWIRAAGGTPGPVEKATPVKKGGTNGQATKTGENPLTLVKGVGPKRAEQLTNLGITSLAELATADAEALSGEMGISEDDVAAWQGQADLSRIHGIGAVRSATLAEHGIVTVEGFLDAEAEVIAENLGVSVDQVTTWQAEADLTTVRGIGAVRATQLRRSGVTTVRDLAAAVPEELAEHLGVTSKTVEGWKRDAIESQANLTDLLEVNGIGPSRAGDLLALGIASQANLAQADAEELAEALSVSPYTIQDWQKAAKNGN